MPIGIAVYAWYIARAFSIYMVYRSIRTKSFGYHAIYHVYRQTLYPMFSYVYPMFSYVYPLFSPGSKQRIYMDDHGILLYMTCSSAVWDPAAAASCSLLARRNAAYLLPA